MTPEMAGRLLVYEHILSCICELVLNRDPDPQGYLDLLDDSLAANTADMRNKNVIDEAVADEAHRTARSFVETLRRRFDGL